MDSRSYHDQPRTPGEWLISLFVGMIVALGCLISMMLLAMFAGSLAASWHGKRVLLMMLAVGGAVSILPAIVLNGFLAWVRQQWNEHALFRDTFFPVLLVGNTLLLVSMVLFLPGKTSQALHQHGDWMFDRKVAAILDINEQHSVLKAGRKLVRRMAYLLEVESQRARIARSHKRSVTPSQGDAAVPVGTRAAPPQARTLGPGQLPQHGDAAPPAPVKDGGAAAGDAAARPLPPLRPLRPPLRAAPMQVTHLQFRRHGSVPEVKIKLGGVPAQYLWDTGASFLTLTGAMARRLGAYPPRYAPSLVVHTANGRVRTRVGLLRSVSIGQVTLRNVAFVLCNACADSASSVQGLLGSNVQRRFRFMVDHSKGHIELRPQPQPQWDNQALDIRPFLKPARLKGSTLNIVVRRVFRLSAVLHNRAAVGVKKLRYQITYMRGKRQVGQRTFSALPLRPGQRREISFMDKSAPKFQRYRLELIEGSWAE